MTSSRAGVATGCVTATTLATLDLGVSTFGVGIATGRVTAFTTVGGTLATTATATVATAGLTTGLGSAVAATFDLRIAGVAIAGAVIGRGPGGCVITDGIGVAADRATGVGVTTRGIGVTARGVGVTTRGVGVAARGIGVAARCVATRLANRVAVIAFNGLVPRIVLGCRDGARYGHIAHSNSGTNDHDPAKELTATNVIRHGVARELLAGHRLFSTR